MSRADPAVAGVPEKYPPEVTATINVDNPSLSDVLAMHIFQRPWRTPNKREQEKFSQHEPDVRKKYAENNKDEIEEISACRNIYAGLVLTKKNDLLIAWQVGQFPDADPLLQACYSLSGHADEYLFGKPRKIAQLKIFDTANVLLGMLDEIARDKPGKEGVFSVDASYLAVFENDLEKIEEFINRSGQRQAQGFYVVGMSLGLAAVIAAAFLLPIDKITTAGFREGPLLGALLGGAVGAWISVISRMTVARAELDYEAHNVTLGLFGLARPLIGAVFGVVIYMMMTGGILSITGPVGGIKELYFFSIVGFLSGFSERFAQDILSVAETSLAARAKKKKNGTESEEDESQNETGVEVPAKRLRRKQR